MNRYAFEATGEDWWVAVSDYYQMVPLAKVAAADYCDGPAYLKAEDLLAFARALTEAAEVMAKQQAERKALIHERR